MSVRLRVRASVKVGLERYGNCRGRIRIKVKVRVRVDGRLWLGFGLG